MRCAVCGSKRVVTESKNEGYNTKKGILGTALFGLSGAILGANGNKTTYYHCADCGQVLNKCMYPHEEEMLERALSAYYRGIDISMYGDMKERYYNAG